ncbi:MAG: hypothetical protein ABL949_08870 [Fimbriimonadaceae bacterium]
MMRRTLIALSAILSAVGHAATYQVLTNEASVTITVTLKGGQRSNEFLMPAWAPGDYQIFDYGQYVRDPVFTRGGAQVPSTTTANPNRWMIPGGADSVTYTVLPSRGNFSPNLQIRGSEVFISGPGVFGWFTGHDREPQTVTIPLADGLVAYSAMKGDNGKFTAESYDVMLDSPIVLGSKDKLRAVEENTLGAPHRIVAFGDCAQADLPGFLSNGVKIAAEAKKLFGNLPYHRYTFFLDFGGPGGGLEHLNGTRIGLGRRSTPAGNIGIMAHEYFHTFNVKRIRALPLGPFDYTKPAMTSTIWWLEGVTDYYSDILSARAGFVKPDDLLSQVWRAAASASTGAYERVSADEASRRVWEARGSFGFGGVSYYSRGHALGFFLDMAIRARSGEKHSLDDVIRKLYKECHPGPGYSETRIRELCIEFGGSALGSLYDKSVMQGGALPWGDILSVLGITQTETGLNSSQMKSSWPFPVKGGS